MARDVCEVSSAWAARWSEGVIRCVCVCVSKPVPKGFHLEIMVPSRGTEHSLANSVQRSYALEWEARIDHPCVPATIWNC